MRLQFVLLATKTKSWQINNSGEHHRVFAAIFCNKSKAIRTFSMVFTCKDNDFMPLTYVWYAKSLAVTEKRSIFV